MIVSNGSQGIQMHHFHPSGTLHQKNSMSMGQYETTKVKVANIFFLFFPTLPPRIALCTLPGVELLGKRRGGRIYRRT